MPGWVKFHKCMMALKMNKIISKITLQKFVSKINFWAQNLRKTLFLSPKMAKNDQKREKSTKIFFGWNRFRIVQNVF